MVEWIFRLAQSSEDLHVLLFPVNFPAKESYFLVRGGSQINKINLK